MEQRKSWNPNFDNKYWIKIFKSNHSQRNSNALQCSIWNVLLCTCEWVTRIDMLLHQQRPWSGDMCPMTLRMSLYQLLENKNFARYGSPGVHKLWIRKSGSSREHSATRIIPQISGGNTSLSTIYQEIFSFILYWVVLLLLGNYFFALLNNVQIVNHEVARRSY